VLALTPAVAGQAPAHGHAGTATVGSDDAAFAAAAASADRGPSWWSIAGWIAAALLAAGMVVAYLRSRRRGEDPTDTNAEQTPGSASTQDADNTVASDVNGDAARIRKAHAGTEADAGRKADAGTKADAGADDAKGTDADKEPVAAGTRLRASSWRYRDTPQ
jgi:flagellar biosynthesis/type III secretory pathway M-ring protein FliF/YscJ